jgi:type IV pilus assembly protein PilY1
MSKYLTKVMHVVLGIGLVAPAMGYASVPFSDVPLFVSGSAKPNLIFAVDDSGSMDYEIVSEYLTDRRYLFNSGSASTVDGGWLTTTPSARRGQVAFVPEYYYLRSSDYNAAYYDPSSTYSPWPNSDSYTFVDSVPSSAKYEPTSSSSATLNLTVNTSDSAGNSFYPATYFRKTVNGSFSRSGGSFRCNEDLTGFYEAWIESPESFSFQGSVAGFGPDDACIEKVEITAGSDEMQNFANWFTYYRRLHQATRGAIGESLIGLSGLNIGTFWIHNLRNVPMWDLDTEREEFLDETYKRFDSNWTGGGTPLRAALRHAGNQYNSNSNIIEAECQKNFTLLFTDGFNNASISNVGNTDGDKGSPYADSKSNTLADVAMKFYDQTLRENDFETGAVRLPAGCFKQEGDPGFSSTMPIRSVPSDPSYDPAADCNSNLHMNTYTVGFGSLGKHFAGIDYSKVRDAYDNPPDWDLISVNEWDENQVDDLYHAAVNGRGEFYNATNVEQLRRSLSAAIRDIIRSTGSATNVTFNTATLEEGSNVYTASFNSGDWSGSVAARELNPLTGNIGSVKWNAADTLNAQDPSQRRIFTYNGGGVRFHWGKLSTGQQGDLNGPDNDNLGEARLAYIRGDRSREGGIFRRRSTVLGDVVNSSPVYAGTPASGWPDRDPFGGSTARYSSFRQDNANRTPMVYVGANDGMLHGFNAETGEELVAYIPSFVYSENERQGLNFLSDPGYEHRFYVDLSPAVSDVYVGNASGSSPSWKTILIGGLRGGGSGIFALDVTNPDQFENTDAAAESTVLWEFSDPRLGQIVEPPQIALVKWANNDYRWSALIPNGYNSGGGKTGLFVLDIESGQGGWTNQNAIFIPLADGQGLSSLRAVDYMDDSGTGVRDGIVDRVYAGDLDGNLWAVDLSGAANQWGSAYKSGGAPQPFFVAKDSNGNRQPITTAPVMGRNIYNTSGSQPNLLVFFGTGRYLSDTDPSSTAEQSFYGVWDQGATVTRDRLEPRSITEKTESGREVREVGGDSIDWTDRSANAVRGWVVDFNTEEGERVIRSPLVRGEYVLFNTVTPMQSLCQSGGTSWTMALRFDGTTPLQAVFDVNNDGQVTGDDPTVAGVRYGDAMILNMNILGDNLYRQASDGTVDQSKIDLGGGKTLGRSGWREVYEQ